MGGTAELDTVEIPMMNFEDISVAQVTEPRLVPSFEDTGPVRIDGLDNFNAESYAPSAPRQQS
jgi:hypothetical protein